MRHVPPPTPGLIVSLRRQTGARASAPVLTQRSQRELGRANLRCSKHRFARAAAANVRRVLRCKHPACYCLGRAVSSTPMKMSQSSLRFHKTTLFYTLLFVIGMYTILLAIFNIQNSVFFFLYMAGKVGEQSLKQNLQTKLWNADEM